MTIEPLPDPATPADAKCWLESLTRTVGLGFHIDTPVSDYVVVKTGKPSFRTLDAERIQADLDRAFQLIECDGGDPYDIALEMIHAIAAEQ